MKTNLINKALVLMGFIIFTIIDDEIKVEANEKMRALTVDENKKLQELLVKLEAKAVIDEKSQAIENHIYANYPQIKQQQDNGWVSNFTTKLVANGVTDLDKKIVQLTTLFFSGKTLDEVLADIDEELKPKYKKLVKVAVKNEWALKCIQEGKKAIAENREPVYPEFPNFVGVE